MRVRRGMGLDPDAAIGNDNGEALEEFESDGTFTTDTCKLRLQHRRKMANLLYKAEMPDCVFSHSFCVCG